MYLGYTCHRVAIIILPTKKAQTLASIASTTISRKSIEKVEILGTPKSNERKGVRELHTLGKANVGINLVCTEESSIPRKSFRPWGHHDFNEMGGDTSFVLRVFKYNRN